MSRSAKPHNRNRVDASVSGGERKTPAADDERATRVAPPALLQSRTEARARLATLRFKWAPQTSPTATALAQPEPTPTASSPADLGDTRGTQFSAGPAPHHAPEPNYAALRPDTRNVFRVSFPRQKALICRHFPCRRRDSNPRHADYDSAALGSTARFEGAGGHERGHIRTAGPPARSGLVLAFALRPKQPSFARGSALRSRPQRARREPQRRRLRSPRASARTTSAGTTAFAFETCDVGPRRGPRHPARPSRHRRQIEL
jgi:hypothetical protein